MNTTRSSVGLAITVPLAALLLVAVAFPLLGAANAQTLPRPEPGVSAEAAGDGAPAADAAIAATAALAGVAHHAPGGVLRDTHGYAYLGKQKAILEHLDRPRRFQTAPTVSPRAPAEHSGGVPRDTHGRAYLGKQRANLAHS